MPEKTPSCCPGFSCRKKFTSDSLRSTHIKLHHPEQFQVVSQKNLTIHSMPRRIEPAQRREFNANKYTVKDFDAFRYLEHVETIADMVSQPLPPVRRTDIYPGAGAPLINYLGEQCERNAQGCLETKLQNNPNYPSAMGDDYGYIQCGIKQTGMKT
jgi:hypothetical protein